MAWIRTVMKPVKICMENPRFPLSEVFRGHDWKLSGGTKQAGVIAAAFICALNAKTVIEIGVWQGFSSRILAKALAANTDDGLLISIDISARNMQHSKDSITGIPIEHRTVVSDSMDLNYDEFIDRPIDLAFIDGCHEYEYAMYDMNKCCSYLKDWGIMIVHDYSKNAHPGVYEAVNHFIGKTRYPMFYMDENRESTDYRTAVIQKRGKY
jgi:predicted O-methyltransferase YrrM